NLEEGPYQFTLKLSGYYDTTFNVSITRNQQTNKDIALTKEVTTGTLYISSSPAVASIFLNDNNTEKTTPNTFYELDEGFYTIKLKLNFYKDTTVNVQVVRQQLTSKDIILTEANPVQIEKISTRLYIQQIRFTFSFNQVVLLDKVEIFEPNGGGNQTFNYSNQEIKKGTNTNIYYPKVVRGTWKLVFYGAKAKDSKTDFVVEADVEVR
ncbi:MAG: PEGA domain-containing protein, partial [Ignavibacteriaceae bacterium]